MKALFIYLISVGPICLIATQMFPPYFRFGAATAAYQVEGGWNADDKGESIWDRTCHMKPSPIANNDTGDVAADSYHRWREDVAIAEEMGLHSYRFSIAWPRILPSGFINRVSNAGARYYSELIDALLAAGIEPVVTLYHWELPVAIQDLGGWTNPLIVDWFADYVRLVYSLYADRVKTWLTINEPMVICDFSYNLAQYASLIREPIFAPFLCTKFVLLAHARAYRIYETEFKPKYNGRVSLANNMVWMEPLTPASEELTEIALQLMGGRFSYPIFAKEGGWPASVEALMLKHSLKQGYNQSRLPSFTEEERKYIQGTADFYALNFYTTYTVRPTDPGEAPDMWFISGGPELGAVMERPRNASYGVAPILPIVPEGLRKMLLWLKQQYGNPDIFITENGYTTSGDQLVDYGRIDFIKDHLEQVLLSIREDGVNVTGYLAWTLIDNFEWRGGYDIKFGLYQVDFKDPARKRTPRASSQYYSCIIKSNFLNDSCRKPPSEYMLLNSRASDTVDYIFTNTIAFLIFVIVTAE